MHNKISLQEAQVILSLARRPEWVRLEEYPRRRLSAQPENIEWPKAEELSRAQGRCKEIRELLALPLLAEMIIDQTR